MQMEVKLHLKIAPETFIFMLVWFKFKKNVSLLEEREALYWTKDENKTQKRFSKGRIKKKKTRSKSDKMPRVQMLHCDIHQ